MMPLTLAHIGETNSIRRVGGSSEQKQHLKDLGFVPGSSITVLSTMGGNLIVKVKESRVAINQEMAGKIFI